MLTKEIEKFIEEHEKEAIELLKELARIPAPSGLEERRAEFCLEWLKKQGAEGVYIDEALNVVYPIDVADEGRVDVFMAHLDVVFPDEDELPLKDCDGRIYCPGVGDDTACVVCLMMAAEYIAAQKKEGKWRKRNDRGFLLVCNSCEEGLGNLKGVKEICRAFEDRISTFCTFDSKQSDRSGFAFRFEQKEDILSEILEKQMPLKKWLRLLQSFIRLRFLVAVRQLIMWEPFLVERESM